MIRFKEFFTRPASEMSDYWLEHEYNVLFLKERQEKLSVKEWERYYELYQEQCRRYKK